MIAFVVGRQKDLCSPSNHSLSLRIYPVKISGGQRMRLCWSRFDSRFAGFPLLLFSHLCPAHQLRKIKANPAENRTFAPAQASWKYLWWKEEDSIHCANRNLPSSTGLFSGLGHMLSFVSLTWFTFGYYTSAGAGPKEKHVRETQHVEKQTFRENKVAFRWARCNVGLSPSASPRLKATCLFPRKDFVFHSGQPRLKPAISSRQAQKIIAGFPPAGLCSGSHSSFHRLFFVFYFLSERKKKIHKEKCRWKDGTWSFVPWGNHSSFGESTTGKDTNRLSRLLQRMVFPGTIRSAPLKLSVAELMCESLSISSSTFIQLVLVHF